jgi:hypothetical protein
MGNVIPFKRRSKPPFNPPPHANKAMLLAERFLCRHDELMAQAHKEAKRLGLNKRPKNAALLHIPEPVKTPWMRARRYREIATALICYAHHLAGLPPFDAAL